MKRLRQGFILTMCLIVSVALGAVTGAAKQNKNDWTKWNEKEAEKMLNDSPWAQTQTDTDTSEMFYSPTSDPRRMGSSAHDNERLVTGATNQAVNIKFHVRFFSAR